MTLDGLERWQKPQRGNFAKPVDVDRVKLAHLALVEAHNANTEALDAVKVYLGHHRGDIVQNREDIAQIIDVVQRMAERVDLLTEALGLDLEPLS